MKEKKCIRNKWLNVRLSAEEYSKIENLRRNTTSQSASEYARNMLLKKPVIVKYRNQSADEILTEMIQLKNELRALGNNFNQAVHKLHMIDKVPEIKTWIIINEALKESFLKKTSEIQLRMNQIYMLWLQK